MKSKQSRFKTIKQSKSISDKIYLLVQLPELDKHFFEEQLFIICENNQFSNKQCEISLNEQKQIVKIPDFDLTNKFKDHIEKLSFNDEFEDVFFANKINYEYITKNSLSHYQDINYTQINYKLLDDKQQIPFEIHTVEIILSKCWQSRGNRFEISQQLLGNCIGKDYLLTFPLYSAQPIMSGKLVLSKAFLSLESGLVTSKTRVNFRSKSFVYMQILDITSDLYEFHNCELNLTRMNNYVLSIFTKLRKEKDLTHQVNLIMYVNLRKFKNLYSEPEEEDYYERIMKLSISDIYRTTVFDQIYQNIKYCFIDILRKVSFHQHKHFQVDILTPLNSTANYFKDQNYVISRHSRGLHCRIFNFNGYSDYLFSRNTISDQLREHGLIKKFHLNYLKSIAHFSALDWTQHEKMMRDSVVPMFQSRASRRRRSSHPADAKPHPTPETHNPNQFFMKSRPLKKQKDTFLDLLDQEEEEEEEGTLSSAQDSKGSHIKHRLQHYHLQQLNLNQLNGNKLAPSASKKIKRHYSKLLDPTYNLRLNSSFLSKDADSYSAESNDLRSEMLSQRMSDPEEDFLQYENPDQASPTVVASSQNSNCLRAFNITNETHNCNNYSRNIDYTGCKTILITLNSGIVHSDKQTFERFNEIHRLSPASYEVISLADKPLYKSPLYVNKNDNCFESMLYVPWHYQSYYADGNYSADPYRFEAKSSTYIDKKNNNLFFPTFKTDHKLDPKNVKVYTKKLKRCKRMTRSNMDNFDSFLFKKQSCKSVLNKIANDLIRSVDNTEEKYNEDIKLINDKYNLNIDEFKPIHYYIIYSQLLKNFENGIEQLEKVNKLQIHESKLSDQMTDISCINEIKYIKNVSLQKNILEDSSQNFKDIRHIVQMRFILNELTKFNLFFFQRELLDLEQKLFEDQDLRNMQIRLQSSKRTLVNKDNNTQDNQHRFCYTYQKQYVQRQMLLTNNCDFLFFPILRKYHIKIKYFELEKDYALYKEETFNINETRYENSLKLMENIAYAMLDYNFYFIVFTRNKHIIQNNQAIMIKADLSEMHYFVVKDTLNLNVIYYVRNTNESRNLLSLQGWSRTNMSNSSFSELDNDIHELNNNQVDPLKSNPYHNPNHKFSFKKYKVLNNSYKEATMEDVEFNYNQWSQTDIQRCFINNLQTIKINITKNQFELHKQIAYSGTIEKISHQIDFQKFQFKQFTILLLNKNTEDDYINENYKTIDNFTQADLDQIYSHTQVENYRTKFNNFCEQFKIENITSDKIKKIFKHTNSCNSRVQFWESRSVNEQSGADEHQTDILFGQQHSSDKTSLLFHQQDGQMAIFKAFKMQFNWNTDVQTKLGTICEVLFKIALDCGLSMVKVSSTVDQTTNFHCWANFELAHPLYALYYLLNKKYSFINRQPTLDYVISNNGFLIIKLEYTPIKGNSTPTHQQPKQTISFIINHQQYNVNWCSVEFYILHKDLQLNLLKGMKRNDLKYIEGAFFKDFKK